MSSDEQKNFDVKTLLQKIAQLEDRIQGMEYQLEEQRKKLKIIEQSGSSVPHVHQQQQQHGDLCSVQGCRLPAVTTCEHGIHAFFSEPCGKKICVRHLRKRIGGLGNSSGTKEYCPMHG